MSVICQCPSCKAKYQVGDQYAGHKIKCPKCSAAVNVPAAPPPSPVVSASDDAGDDMAFAQAADDSLSFLGDASSRIHHGERSGKHRATAHDSSVLSDTLAKSGISSKSSVLGHGHHPKKKKKSGSGLLIAGIVGGCVAIVGLIGGVIYYNWRAKADNTATASDDKKPKMPGVDPNVPKINFTFKWPENERTGATLIVNGEVTPVPASGEFKIPLPKISKPYHFVLERQGFLKQEFSRTLADDDDYIVTQWQSENRGIDWEQDFAAAKKAAAGPPNKNILIVFDASDVGSAKDHFHSTKFNDSVITSPDFAEKAKDYICVYIDIPVTDEKKKKVHDLAQNKKLTGDFEVKVFPTVVVTDSKGRPFGVMEDFTINGVVPFIKLMEKWDHDSQILFPLLDKAKDSSDTETISKTLEFLELNKLDRFYAKTARALAEKLPSGSREVTEQEAEFWLGKFRMGTANPDNIKKDMEDFNVWKSRHSFTKHPDVGAALNAFAALVLVQAGDKEAAKKMCDAASAYKTKDPRIRDLLAALQRHLTGKAGNMEPLPRGSGSGFCIAAGNYIMTNHHVIRDAKKIMIHLNDEEERYPAHLVADNPDGDMAVLKVDLPADKALTPIPFAATDVITGEEVCARMARVLSDNPASVLTKGIVSTKHKDDGYLVVDCKIEHGNSGGPLCSVSGCCIAGMVSAKTATTGELSESYGLAIPASQLKKFLKEKLPRDVLARIPRQTSSSGGKLSETVKRITPSVVYVENLQ